MHRHMCATVQGGGEGGGGIVFSSHLKLRPESCHLLRQTHKAVVECHLWRVRATFRLDFDVYLV